MENSNNSNTPFTKLGDSSLFADNNDGDTETGANSNTPFIKLGESYFADNNDSDTETEANSFIILGKDSLDAIQVSSLASYVDIQQKSMSVDYNSMVTSLATNEIHQKLAELLQENTKLKETLKKNNFAMVSWQNMVMKLYEKHMEKFKETTNLISDLKKENLELKTKLATQQTEDMKYNFEAINTISDFDNSNIFTSKAILQKSETSASFTLEKKINNTLPNVNSNNISYKILPQEEASMSSVTDEEKKKEENTKYKVMKEKFLLENCEKQICEYDTIHDGVIDSFVKFEESCPAINDINKLIYSVDKCEMNPIWNVKDYEDNRIYYNNLMSELVKNFVKVINRCRALTNCLSNMTPIFAAVEETINKKTVEENLELLKERIAKYKTLAPVYNQLIHPDNDINYLILTFSDALKNVQEHIRNVFVDYWENLNMMYLMIDEILNMTDAHNNSQKQTEVQQKLKMLSIQQSKMQKLKKELDERTHELNLQYQSLNDEKHRMHEATDILHEQLMRRKNLYDGKVRALLNERLLLMRDQKIDSTDLLEKYTRKNIECEKLQCELDQITSEINVYKSQMSVYEEDFRQERSLRESLLQENNKLDAELQKQVNYNKQLTDRLSTASFRSTLEERSFQSSSKEVMTPCPKCEKTFATLQSLTEHIEQCLNLC